MYTGWDLGDNEFKISKLKLKVTKVENSETYNLQVANRELKHKVEHLLEVIAEMQKTIYELNNKLQEIELAKDELQRSVKDKITQISFIKSNKKHGG